MESEMSKYNPPPYEVRSQNSPNPEPQIMPAVAPIPMVQSSPPSASVNNIVIRNANEPLATTRFGPKPQLAICPYCHIQSKTTIKTKALKKAHYWALGLFLIGFWPCICCPYKCCNCSKVLHSCGNCGSFLGTCDP